MTIHIPKGNVIGSSVIVGLKAIWKNNSPVGLPVNLTFRVCLRQSGSGNTWIYDHDDTYWTTYSELAAGDQTDVYPTAPVPGDWGPCDVDIRLDCNGDIRETSLIVISNAFHIDTPDASWIGIISATPFIAEW